MEITQIAQQAVDALKPALPFLTTGGGMVAVGAARAMGKDAWDTAKGLWATLRGTDAATSQALVKAATRVATRPEDDDAVAALRAEVRDVLEADSSLLRDVAALLDVAGARTRTVQHIAQHGDGGLAVGTNAKVVGKGGVLVEGDVHRGVKIVEIKDRTRGAGEDD